jgi:hypothetical protein
MVFLCDTRKEINQRFLGNGHAFAGLQTFRGWEKPIEIQYIGLFVT